VARGSLRLSENRSIPCTLLSVWWVEWLPCESFEACRVCTDSPWFILILIVCVLSDSPFVCLWRDSKSILLNLSKNKLSVSSIFPLLFLFQFYWFLPQLLLFSSFCLLRMIILFFFFLLDCRRSLELSPKTLLSNANILCYKFSFQYSLRCAPQILSCCLFAFTRQCSFDCLWGSFFGP